MQKRPLTENYEDLKSPEKAKKIILGMKVNETYRLPSWFRYDFITIDRTNYGIGLEYSWALQKGFTSCVFPLVSSNKIKTWKTEKGAKLALYRHLESYFKELEKNAKS